MFTNAQAASFPGGRQWLVPAIVLATATAATRPRRLPLTRLASALVVVAVLVWLAWLSRENGGAFFFLRWPLALIIVVGIAFGAVAPRLAVVACGLTLAAIPSVVAYLSGPNPHFEDAVGIARTPQGPSDPVVIVLVGVAVVLGAVVPLAHLARRRLT